ncbi:MAG: GGDEF domain-containing protein [Thermodesulfobacteriota bacterium]
MLSSILFFGANYFFVFTYFREKAERRLDSSYDELRRSMSFDELTGVYNRRAGMARLKEEYARVGRTERKLTLAMVDVDNFKFINDSCGHQTGDQILRHIAGIIKHWLRENDVVFRYGGDEFLLILPETDEKQAMNPLNRLRKRLADQVIIGGFNVRPSVSIGVATLLDGDEGTDNMIDRADRALYAAKKRGRNRVTNSSRGSGSPNLKVFNG